MQGDKESWRAKIASQIEKHKGRKISIKEGRATHVLQRRAFSKRCTQSHHLLVLNPPTPHTDIGLPSQKTCTRVVQCIGLCFGKGKGFRFFSSHGSSAQLRCLPIGSGDICDTKWSPSMEALQSPCYSPKKIICDQKLFHSPFSICCQNLLGAVECSCWI